MIVITNIPLPLILYTGNLSLFVIFFTIILQYLFIGVLIKAVCGNSVSNKEGNKIIILWLFALWIDKVKTYIIKE